MKCKDCAHYKLCRDLFCQVDTLTDDDKRCDYFEEARPHGKCKMCKHFVKNGFDGIKYVCEHPEIQLDDYYDYACIMMEDNDFCSRYEPREKEGEADE